MPLTIKLVGTPFEIRSSYCGSVALSNIVKIFLDKNMSIEEINMIKFIYKSEQMTHNTNVLVLPNTIEPFFVFSDVPEVKQKLCLVFISLQSNEQNQEQNQESMKNQNVEPETVLKTGVVDTVDNAHVLPVVITKENIDTVNLKTMKLFENSDFKKLVSIYYSNPSIIKTFLSFINNGNIVDIPFDENIQSHDIDIENSVKYFRELGITTENENIIKALNMFKGHLNLTLRYLLCNYN
jgi:hypothetical protein